MFSPVPVVEILAGDPTRLEREELREAIASCEDLRSWVSGREARLTRALDALPDDPTDPAPDTAGRVERDQNVSRGQAKRRTDNAEQLEELPATQSALEEAAITSAHADAMARARAKADPQARAALEANEERLLGLGAGEPAAEFAKRLERFVARHSQDDGRRDWERRKARRQPSIFRDRDGMTQIQGTLDPESGRVVKSLIDRIADELYRRDHQDHPADAEVPVEERSNEQRQADALVEACSRADGKEHAASVPDRVVVILQYEELLDRLAAEGHPTTLPDGTPIPAGVARRLACDAGILPLVLGGESLPLDLGRTKRLHSPAQRTALQALWATCSFADCRVPFD